jgi:hypothetical protein
MGLQLACRKLGQETALCRSIEQPTKRLERFVGGLFSLATKKEGQEKLPNPPHLTALL